jgi:ABC-2 type transport system ATP-binding protein
MNAPDQLQPSGARDATTALLVEGVSHAFGKRPVLKDVGFTIRPGEFIVLLGLNGAGKTTLFSLVTRLYDHRSGRIEVFGKPVRTESSAALARMGVVFQQLTLDLDLTVEQNLFYHASLQGLARRTAAERIAIELERIGLAERRKDKVRQLSGGQRRRVEIARALLHQPSLLLLDEPTVGLDIASRRFLLDHIRKLCREDGLAALWATHLIDEIGEGARVIVLHQGRVLAAGTVPEILAATGARDIPAAFAQLTELKEAPTGEAAS